MIIFAVLLCFIFSIITYVLGKYFHSAFMLRYCKAGTKEYETALDWKETLDNCFFVWVLCDLVIFWCLLCIVF